MKCGEIRRLMPLYGYGELTPADEERFEAHVHGCEACSAALRKQREFDALMDGAAVSPPEGMLTISRLALRARLAEEPLPHGWRAWFRDAFSFRVSAAPVWAQMAAGVALVATGYFGGRVTPLGRAFGASEASLSGTPVASQVRYVEPDNSGRVEIVVDETRQRMLTGRPEDDDIRPLLMQAAQEAANPAMRAQSVELLKRNCGLQEIRRTLLVVLKHDPNPEVRLVALDGLKPFAGEAEMRQVFSHVLFEDRNADVRTRVVEVLSHQRQDEMVGLFQDLMGHEDDADVRQRIRKALEEMNASADEY